MKKIFCSGLILVVFGLKSMGQDQFSGWIASFNTVKINSRTSIHAELQLRSSNQFTRVQTFLLRGGLNYRVRENVTVTTGYGLIEGYRRIANASGYSPEHRIWQQVIFTQKFARVQMTHRGRLEQRFLGKPVVDGNGIKTNNYGFASRARYFNRSLLPFNRQHVFTKGMFAALQDEVFLNIGNKRNVNGNLFDQNRAYIAAGYRFNPSFDLEAGYMHQYVKGASGEFTNHIIQLAGYIRL